MSNKFGYALAIQSLNLIPLRAEYPKLHKALKHIEQSVVAAATEANPQAGPEIKERVALATKKLTPNPEENLTSRKQLITSTVTRATQRLETGAAPDPTPINNNISTFQPNSFTGWWMLEHRLAHVHCVQETPGPGEDEMFFAGNYSYADDGVLKTYAEDFDSGDSDAPNLTLARVMLQPGNRVYRAVHLVTEEDLLGSQAAQAVASGITFLLDILAELGMEAAKSWLRGEARDARPSGADATDWNSAVDEAIDELEEEVEEAKDGLLDRLRSWIAEALGPEKFDTVTTNVRVNWPAPMMPQVQSVQSGSQRGAPYGFVGGGVSVISDVPFTRSGGGHYKTMHIVQVYGQMGNLGTAITTGQ